MMLLYLIMIVALMAVFSVIILKMTVWMISKLGHQYVEQTHRSAEFIINTGFLPPFWFKEGKQHAPPLLDKYLCLKKTRKIISYFQKSQVAGDEYSRSIIVAKLTERYNQWIELDWETERPFSSDHHG